jgi:hypothetical protein
MLAILMGTDHPGSLRALVMSNNARTTTSNEQTMLCEDCLKQVALVHLTGSNPGFSRDSVRPAAHLCERCARRLVRTLPQTERLLFSAEWREGERGPKVLRKYVVVESEEHSNKATLEVKNEWGQDAPRRLTVRRDMIPIQARASGSEFRLSGSPLEIEIFEGSSQ